MRISWSRTALALVGTLALLGAGACGDEADPNTTTSAAQVGAGSGLETASGAAAAAGSMASTEDRAGWPDVLRLGYFGGDDADEVLNNVEPHRAYLEETLGMPVEIFTGTSYGAVIEAMRAKRVDGMQVGPFSYVLAVQEAGAEALAVGVSCSSSVEVCEYNPDASTHYFSIVITKKGNGIDSLDDLRGVDFAFVDPASTSGHLAPKTRLITEGLDPDTEMNTIFAGSHPTAVLALWNDNVQAAATHQGNLLNLLNEGQVEACFWEDGADSGPPRTAEEIQQTFDNCPDGHIVILAQTDPIPSTPFAVRSDLPDSLKQALKDAYLSIRDNPEQVEASRRWYVDPTEELGLERLDQYYNSLRDIARLLDLDLAELE